MIKEVLAVGPTAIPISIAPGQGLPPGTEIGLIINNALKIIIVIAVLAVLFMLIFGAFQWIISGGDKEKVASARNNITHALIGMAILGLAFVIITVVSGIVGVNILGNLEIPALNTLPK